MAVVDVHVELEVPTHEKTVEALGHEIVHDFLDLPCIHFLYGLWLEQLRENCLVIIIDDSLAFFNGVVCRLVEGDGISLSAGVAEGIVFLESAGTAHSFLTD